MGSCYLGSGKLAGVNSEIVAFLKNQTYFAPEIIIEDTTNRIISDVRGNNWDNAGSNIALIWSNIDSCDAMVKQNISAGSIAAYNVSEASAETLMNVGSPWNQERIELPYLLPTVLFDGYSLVGAHNNRSITHDKRFWQKIYTGDNQAKWKDLNSDAWDVFFSETWDDMDRFENDIIAGTTHNVFMTKNMFKDYVELSARIYHHIGSIPGIRINSLSETPPWINENTRRQLYNDDMLPFLPIARKAFDHEYTSIDCAPYSIIFESYNHHMFIKDNMLFVTYVQDVIFRTKSFVPFLNGTVTKAYPTIEGELGGVIDFNYDAYVISRFYDVFQGSLLSSFNFRTPILAKYEILHNGNDLDLKLISATSIASNWSQATSYNYELDPKLPGGVSVRDMQFTQIPWDISHRYGGVPIYTGKYNQHVDYRLVPVQGPLPLDDERTEVLLASELDADTNLFVNVMYLPWSSTNMLGRSRLILTAFDITQHLPERPDDFFELAFEDEHIIHLELTHYNGEFYLAVSRAEGYTSYVVAIKINSLSPLSINQTRILTSGKNRISVRGIKDGGML